ncbi:538_t:CDS:2 [Cetraspora pellucida]|uniref:538_t:CDS:1 n=1 Tax=Cetraspora pellucida TaxID=1433469 RepID=A0ACA9QA82_9GLOM|nr:538_t:CDS:2 [Cetraspora pellucida]
MDIDNNEYISDIEYTSDVRQTFDTNTQSDAEEDAKEGMEDICKIIVIRKDKETIYKKKYKHDGGTKNMKLHLWSAYGIFGPDEIQLNPDEKHQLSIAKMFKKVIPHSESKQLELK